jgi:nicotinate-nucleotide adenylyltransferase
VRLGVLGGSFDPVHRGHLHVARCALSALALERVLLVPCRVPPHRPEPRASAYDRHAMLALACAGQPALVPSALELERAGPSYTVDTLLQLQSHGRPELFLIVGGDTFPEMTAWRDATRLFGLCSVAVVPRPGSAPPAPRPGLRMELVAGAGVLASSSEVRRRLAAGEDARDLLEPSVDEYIAKRGLYR